MGELKTIIKYLKRILQQYYILIEIAHSRKTDDRIYIAETYKKRFGKELRLYQPKLFTEKVQVLKLMQENEDMTMYADKLLAHKLVSEILGENYVTEIVEVVSTYKDISKETLKKGGIIIKCNHDSNSSFRIEQYGAIDAFFLNWIFTLLMKTDYYLLARENGYKKIEKKIFVEKTVKNIEKDIKLFVLNGKARLIQIDDIATNERNFYKYDEIEFIEHGTISASQIDQLMNIAEKICPRYPFCRIDFMMTSKETYFTEFTFYPAAGYYHYPNNIDEWLGGMLEI